MLNVDRKGLDDDRSHLFYEMRRVELLLKDLWPDVRWGSLYENVDNAPDEDIQTVSDVLGYPPLNIDAGDFSHTRRSRLYWINFPLDGEASGALQLNADRTVIHLERDRGDASRWLDEGASFDEGNVLPTFVRVVPRKRPPKVPAGIRQCEPHELDRWREGGFATPPYQYRDINTIGRPDGSRSLASPTERELLLGFPFNHTAPAVQSSKLKDPSTICIRQSLLGNSFHCEAVAWLVGQWAFCAGLRTEPASMEEIRARVILDGRPEYLTQLRDEAIAASDTSADILEQETKWRGWGPSERLVVDFITKVNHKGSDVRLSTGQILNPSLWPRSAISPSLWRWILIARWDWRWTAHINVLEARASLAQLKWRFRRKEGVHAKFLHLMDSQVAIAVMTKRRSSSHLLNAVCRRVGALELAASSHALYGFCRSDDNPSDEPTRLPEP